MEAFYSAYMERVPAMTGARIRGPRANGEAPLSPAGEAERVPGDSVPRLRLLLLCERGV